MFKRSVAARGAVAAGVMAGLFLVATPAFTQDPPPTLPVPPPATAPAGPVGLDPLRGKATFEAICGMCHEKERAAAVGRTREGWNQIVDMMLAKGMTASDEQIAEITDYLVATYPAAPGAPPAPTPGTAPAPTPPGGH